MNQGLLAGADEFQALAFQARQGLVELLFGLDAACEVAGRGDPHDAIFIDDSEQLLDRGRQPPRTRRRVWVRLGSRLNLRGKLATA